jgi:hypothetical protein
VTFREVTSSHVNALHVRSTPPHLHRLEAKDASRCVAYDLVAGSDSTREFKDLVLDLLADLEADAGSRPENLSDAPAISRPDWNIFWIGSFISRESGHPEKLQRLQVASKSFRIASLAPAALSATGNCSASRFSVPESWPLRRLREGYLASSKDAACRACW